MQARALTMQTVSNLHTDRGSFRLAREVCEATTAETERYVRQGVLRPFELADGFQRLAGARLRYGLARAGADAAHDSLAAFEQLITEGRADLVSEAAKTRTVLATALLRIGELDGAAQELEEGIRTYRGLPATDVALDVDLRTHPGSYGAFAEEALSGDSPDPPGARLRDSLVRALTLLLADVRRTLDAGPGDIKEHLARHETIHTLAAEMGRNGELREASVLLERTVGELTWLARTFPGDEVEWLRGRTGQLLGWYSMQSGRGGAAEQGFCTAVDSFRVLTGERKREDFAEPWLEAYIGWAAARTVEGDDAGADEVVRGMRQHAERVRPLQAAAWDWRTAETLGFLREHRG
ncbi:hypothetical protein AB0894_06410 [Streptomyces sp. NPDC047916]|uniref:hypothetical protein n=1 Tax=Streptomyces sp. NPDC047916 TaxID=3156681 RepID=UPI003457148F